MFNRFVRRSLNFLALGSCVAFSISLMAQDAWQSIRLSNHGKQIQTLKAIGIKAIAECNGQNNDAYIIVWGRVDSGIFTIGILVNGYKRLLPNNELDDFRGPDLSRKAIEKDAIGIDLKQGKEGRHFSTRLVMGATVMLPDNVRGELKEYFETNVRPGIQEEKKWMTLLDTLALGIGESRLVIGDNVLSKTIVVKFGGRGVAPLARDLIAFIEKK